MKKIIILSLSAFVLAACTNANQPTVNTNQPSVNKTTVTTQNNSLVVSSHSTDKPAAPAVNSNPSSQQSSPNQQAIDVSEMTAKIEKAEKEYKAKPADAKAKENLAAAYFERAFALTKAAQYRAALGDFRKGLKLNPNDKEARDMHDQIISIFESIGREPPKEGEEPPPLPFKKES
jgi:tetratricopeptide (TPR) repeat protein